MLACHESAGQGSRNEWISLEVGTSFASWGCPNSGPGPITWDEQPVQATPCQSPAAIPVNPLLPCEVVLAIVIALLTALPWRTRHHTSPYITAHYDTIRPLFGAQASTRGDGEGSRARFSPHTGSDVLMPPFVGIGREMRAGFMLTRYGVMVMLHH